MIMLEFDLKLNANIVAYEILHSQTRNRNFSVYKQGFMKFYTYDRRVVRFRKLP
jgi:hypothetical protein